MNETSSVSIESQILSDIRNSEKKADEILQKAQTDREAILHNAAASASVIATKAQEGIRAEQEKKAADAREKAKLIRAEKLAESKAPIRQLRSKSDKSASKAADFIVKKFEEMF